MQDVSTLFIFVCLFILQCNTTLKAEPAYVYDVTTFGAVGDGQTDSTQAFMKAWEALREAEHKTSILQIPPGKVFLVQPLTFQGPTKSITVRILVLGTILAPEKSSWEGTKYSWIHFESISGLTLHGQGKFVGAGESWYVCAGCTRPTSIHFNNCNGLQIMELTSVSSPRNHISISSTNGAILSNLRLIAPETSPNTDGIDISHSTQIQIRDSFISTGDDCVAINSGSSYINITNVACGPGHGISVGSLGAAGSEDTVENVFVESCNLTGSMYGLRIKTWQGGAGYARKITYQNIQFQAVRYPIIIDQNYCPTGDCEQKPGNVQVSDVSYIGLQGTSAVDMAITFNCSESVPCTDIVMKYVQIESVNPGVATSSGCSNAYGTSVSTSPIVPCLTL